MRAYDTNNIFAKILRGEIPCEKVFEDDLTFVFMDIMPRADGHALVIPKAPACTILDIEDSDLAAVALMVKRVAIAGKAAFNADGITLSQFNEPAGGQEVPHLHFHVIPRKQGIAMRPPASVMAEPAVLAAQAEKLRAALGG